MKTPRNCDVKFIHTHANNKSFSITNMTTFPAEWVGQILSAISTQIGYMLPTLG